ncbi:ATP-dependent RNA helicase mrh4, mitochondrial [Golovinomyces cichoracearum]|uniref:RNA helicase n=1 Tax=Golovinomyces cichoracearum TaxID=62708 RepID=A0A420IVH5_9PEZI|nr:ATP-dependent RNA helicase mrh4, mitochondrial [Golovinomyces cichoracearum]
MFKTLKNVENIFATPPRCLYCSFLNRQARNISLRARKPARLTLQKSKIVGLAEKKPIKSKPKGNNGPFGGTNLKKANIRDLQKRSPVANTLVRKTNEDPRITSRGKRKRMQKGTREFKALKMQSSLAKLSYQQRSSIKNEIQGIESFEEFRLLESVSKSIYTQALQGLINVKPTPVQKIAIPALLALKNGRQKSTEKSQESFLIAAETGSGKTLAYLLPTINALKLNELNDVDIKEYEKKIKEEKERQNNVVFFSPPLTNISHPTAGRPRVIILVPTQELVSQVGAIVKSLGHTIKFRSAMISSAFTATVIRNRLFSSQGIDIVVTTPHLMASVAAGHPNILSRVTHLIIDEADSLLDRSFAPLTSTIIDRATPSLKQLILCSATIPLALDGFIRSRFPDTKRLVTPNLHAIPRRVQLEVINVEGVPYHGSKDLACADALWSIGRAAENSEDLPKGSTEVKRVIVFVNEREKTLELRDFLISKGVDAIALNRDTPDERKAEVISSFTTPVSLDSNEDQSHSSSDIKHNFTSPRNKVPPGNKKLSNVKTVVTTDLSSRGIDTIAVRNVILYDVPHSTIDFIHRLGRTGRMGRRGRAYVLVGKDDRKDIVAEVKTGMFLGKSLI